METITDRLQTVRRKWCEENFGLGEIEDVLSDVTKAVSAGTNMGSFPFNLAAYYFLKIMTKSVNFKQTELKSSQSKATHIFIFSPDLCQVLVPCRGHFKRLFPRKKTISVCGHTGTAIEIIQQAFQGVPLKDGRLVLAGEFQGYLRSAEFIAFSKQEEKRLKATYKKYASNHSIEDGLVLDYCKEKHSLLVYSFKEGKEHENRYQELVGLIEAEVEIKSYRSLQHHPSVPLYLYVLTEEEKGHLDKWITEHNKTREKAMCSLQHGVEEDYVERLARKADSDNYAFLNWHDLLHEFNSNWCAFALDLCAPYLGNDAVIEKIEMLLASTLARDVISLDEPFARLRTVSGGKGSNLHNLRKLVHKTQQNSFEPMHATWSVPDGVIVTPLALNQCLEKNGLYGMVKSLDFSTNSGDELRQRIKKISIGESLGNAIWENVKGLGAQSLVVRSSSTGEDSLNHAGAGLAESVLRVPANKDDILQAIKIVWASLFSRSFFEYRRQHGVGQHHARMAVVIQPMIDADAYGVMMSIDPKTARPGFWIAANHVPGGVVDSQAADRWFVSPDAECVLEKRQCESTSGLSEFQILALAAIGKEIHEHFVKAGLAKHVDVEFAVQKNNYYILQTRPVTTIDLGEKRRNLVETVDLSTITESLPEVFLNGLGVSNGVGVGKLQIVEDPFGFHTVEQDVILVTQNTNNDWNHVFKKIRGVVTRRGNMMSHAATNARECGIPAIVGVDDAIDLLKKYEGQTVTLDAHLNRLYVGEVPIIRVSTPMCLWLDSEKLSEVKRSETQKLHKLSLWDYLQPFGQTFENSRGRWLGKPKRQYGYFQLDYYWRAWDMLAKTLNEMFPNKPQVKAPVKREIVNRMLCFPIVENTQPNFKHLFKTLDLGNFEQLMRERWRAFKFAQNFFNNLENFDKSNVRQVVEILVGTLSWMHVAFYFHWYFDRRYLQPQLRCIDSEYRYNLLELAASIDSDPDNVYKGNILKEKYIELDIITEEIKADPEVCKNFEQESLSFIREDLGKHEGIWVKVENLSSKYKHGSEDIRQESDTDKYLHEFAGRIKGNYTITDEQMIRYCQQYIWGNSSDELQKIRICNPHLYDLLLIYTRYDKEKIDDLIKRSQQRQWETRQAFEPILRRYPQLQRVLSLARQEAALREDGHQLITRWQRKIMPMMLEYGRQAVAQNVLNRPEDVFDLGLEEVVALVEYGFAHKFIGKSIKRRISQEHAERGLEKSWKAANKMQQNKHTEILNDLCLDRSPSTTQTASQKNWHQLADHQARVLWSEVASGAIQTYEKNVIPIIEIVQKQSEEARNKEMLDLATYYEEEIKKIKDRIYELQGKIDLDNHEGTLFYPC